MIVVKRLIWDDWNRKHMNHHGITQEDIEEVCHGKHKVRESYRKRILITGKTKRGKQLAIVLSPEDRNLRPYSNGTYYVITAFIKEVKS